MFVSAPKPAPGRVTSLATTRSAFLRASLPRAFSIRSFVSAANATSTCPGRLRAPSAAAMSVVGLSASAMPSPVFLILVSETDAGVKSAGAAA